jgi:hypothetical protein
VGHLFIFGVELISGGEALMKILDSTPHGKNLKKSSQINGLGIKKKKEEEIYIIQEELKEAKEEIKNKGEEISKIISFNESLIKEVKNLKQEKTSKGKWEKDESREDLKNKDEEICRL